MTLIRATQNDFKEAVGAFQAGEPVLIHDFDSREGETDFVIPASAVSREDVTQMRNDAGGLICVALAHEVAESFDLPFVADVIDHPAAADHDLEYDERSSFSLTVNHRETFTGITDTDRARTIRELGRSADDPAGIDFASEFRTPGHVHLLRAAPELLSQRRGHTEFGIALARAANVEPAVVVCEMLDDETGLAKTKQDAFTYAAEHDIPFVDGPCLVDMLCDRARPYPNVHPSLTMQSYPNAEGPIHPRRN